MLFVNGCSLSCNMYLNMSKGVWPRTLVTFLLKGYSVVCIGHDFTDRSFVGPCWSHFCWRIIRQPRWYYVFADRLRVNFTQKKLIRAKFILGPAGQAIHKCVMKNLWIKLLTLTKYERQQTFKSSSLASTDPPNQMLDKPIFGQNQPTKFWPLQGHHSQIVQLF